MKAFFCSISLLVGALISLPSWFFVLACAFSYRPGCWPQIFFLPIVIGGVLIYLGWRGLYSSDPAPAIFIDRGTSEHVAAPSSGPDITPREEELMREYGITRVGRKFYFTEYQYDRLKDAIAYAELQTKRAKQK